MVLLAVCAVLPANAQQTDALQEQLRQLVQQYEQTTRELRERIDALEQQIQKKDATTPNETKREGTVSVVELAAEAAKKAGSVNVKSGQGASPKPSGSWQNTMSDVADRLMG